MSDKQSKKGLKKYGKRYTPQFRKKVVKEIENGEKTFSEVIRTYNLNDSTLCSWLRLYRENGEKGLESLTKSGRKKEKLYKKRGQEILESKKYLTQQEELRLLRMQNQYYEKVIALLTKDDSKKKPNNKEKAQIIKELKEEHKGYKLRELLVIAELNRSTYYEIINKENKDKYKETKEKILEIYNENNKIYGYRRIRQELIKEGYKISRKLTLKLMKELKIQGIRSKSKSKYNSYKGEEGTVVENLLNRDFKANSINEKWVTDISELKINGKKLYLSPLIDLYNDEVISYELTNSPTIEVVKKMVEKGLERIEEGSKPILHSDQGCQYRSASYQKYLQNNNIQPSMSRKGNCWDNAKAENFFSILKSRKLL